MASRLPEAETSAARWEVVEDFHGSSERRAHFESGGKVGLISSRNI